MTVKTLLVIALGVACAAPVAAHAHLADRDGGPEIVRGWASFNAATPTARTAQAAQEPPIVATPRANCGPGSKPEPDIQGRMPKEEVDSGRADDGYWCNLTVVGRSGNTGGFRVHRYVDRE